MGSGLLASINQGASRSAQWAAVALGFSIPISTALDNVLLAVLLAGWLASGNWRAKWDAARGSRVALVALALFGLLLAGTIYGTRHPGDTSTYLAKYSDLLFIPVFAFLLRDAEWRRRALYALAASLMLVLVMSYLIAAGLPVGGALRGSSTNPVVLKQYLTHSILMAYGAILFAELAFAETSRWRRRMWAAAAFAAAVNVLFLTQSRTGYVLLALLVIYFALSHLRLRERVLALAALAAVVVALVFIPGPFQQRMGFAKGEQDSSLASQYARISNTERLEMYRVTIAIIRDHPLLGVGTGGFRKAYAERSQGGTIAESRNPHSEYLLITAQIGMPGLLVLVYLFWVHWRTAAKLPTPREQHLARGIVLTIAAGCLFNSLLLDHTEGLLYAWLTGLLFAGPRSPDERA